MKLQRRRIHVEKDAAQYEGPTKGKLGANWAGPFKIISKTGQEAYRLEDMEGKILPRPWNVQHLKDLLLNKLCKILLIQ